MSDWRTQPEIDPLIIQTLVNAVGVEVFAGMKDQFVTDLRSLGQAYYEALANSDEDQAKASAHALKGAASNIGLVQLSQIAAELERDASDPGAALTEVLDRSISRLESAS
ncbi:Hpt domain-containing protein [uncultured Maricaulis sp.]|uniref:Hpt domain-containing protein n=1 Tax=uncultured Maricaulis sp. TaxID=174710 RepID=UPI0025FF49A4|nr:Hpt domain-containing protein [uncultured Maricaulis sp.]